MLAAPRLNCAIRAWSAAIGTGFRRSTALLPPISSTTWQKVVTVSGCSYSHSTVGATISAVDFQPDEKILKVRWASGDVDSYPYLWLRDNCQCTKCFHPMSQSRRVMLKDLSLSLNCKDIKLPNS
ncbi:Gamma-butyrobetaine dioxygenase [Portunus trituberculatus]|uniref:Gamma-butyrobetaine dioxygenase n=1 Tax=Portunus trituberculatus TaxID=210409 RepID=A0A5B7GAQ4_PORTR|nr:Gamma-butyrobetaine dioxygenase [Portunus trituberculatus]